MITSRAMSPQPRGGSPTSRTWSINDTEKSAQDARTGLDRITNLDDVPLEFPDEGASGGESTDGD